MEKRILGIIFTIIGAIGLVLAGMNFINNGSETYNVKMIAVYGILGLIFFFSGMGLIRSTKDIRNKNEEIS
jgi:uncharacterized membrane protein